MRFYEQLQALGKGPKDSDEANPPQADVMAKGRSPRSSRLPVAPTSLSRTTLR